jgi:hypothetical protein
LGFNQAALPRSSISREAFALERDVRSPSAE